MKPVREEAMSDNQENVGIWEKVKHVLASGAPVGNLLNGKEKSEEEIEDFKKQVKEYQQRMSDKKKKVD